MAQKVLVYTNYPISYQEKLEKAFSDSGYDVIHVVPDSKDPETTKAAVNALTDCTIAILGGALPLEVIENAKELKWVHYDWVGIEGVMSKNIFEKGILVTNGSGRNSICLAEHVFYFIFTLTYETRAIFASQDGHQWGVQHEYPYTSLYGKTMVIAGTGSIAQEVAKRAKAFGMKTIGYCRSVKPGLEMFDELKTSASGVRLVDVVPEADFLVSTLSLNASSFHMIDAAVLANMKKTAYVINISRGSVIDEIALTEALENKVIAGAGCDTFEQEPLAADSPLWNLKNMVITPHSTPQSPLKFEIGVDTIVSNIERFKRGEKLLNQQSPADLLVGK